MTLEWRVSDQPVAYEEAVREMERRVGEIREGSAAELAWLLEHSSIYTAGTSAKPCELLLPERFPVYPTGRGGRYTYHGPGQRVAYLMLDLKRRGCDVRAYVRGLEEWLLQTLARFGVAGIRESGAVGVWVDRGGGRTDKIAAIGVRVRRWVTYHGISLNVDPDLDHYAGIVPCGVADRGVTSLTDLGIPVTMAEVDRALKACFEKAFPAA